MKLYLLTGTASGNCSYDSCIVSAENEEEAKKIHPEGDFYDDIPENKWEAEHGSTNQWLDKYVYQKWAKSPEDVKVEEIGTAKQGTKRSMILADYTGDCF